MQRPPISDDERRRLVGEAHTDEGLERALSRLHGILRDLKQEAPDQVGAFERMLTALDEGLHPDDPVAVLVGRYLRGVVTRAELLAHPDVRERIRARTQAR